MDYAKKKVVERNIPIQTNSAGEFSNHVLSISIDI